MSERRRDRRYECVFLVRVGEDSEGEWAAISRDASKSGLLMAVGPRMQVGDELTLGFRVSPETGEDVKVKGKIVRVDENVEDPKGYWPHRVAVEFIEPVPEVEPFLEELEKMSS